MAIIGRQNVGKSTLLNRLAGKPIAITADVPGTTRDRISADVSWGGKDFKLVDTGGLEPRTGTGIPQRVKEQVFTAMAEADVLVWLLDGRDGVTPFDMEIAGMLRKSNKPVILAVNKVDSARQEAGVSEFYELALGEPLPVSAYHGRGTAELLDKIVASLPDMTPFEAPPEAMKIAIVGRPNVGKSMLLNALLGEERAIVSPQPGTTRDAIDTPVDFQGQSVLLIDTAGIRRRGKLDTGIERYSVIRAMRAIERADIALLVLDATEPFTAQDTHVAGYIQQAMKGIIIVVNKWDLVNEKNMPAWDKAVRNEFKFISYAPVIYTSAVTGYGVKDIMPRAIKVYRERLKLVPDTELKSAVQQAVAAHSPPRAGARQLRFLSVEQTGVKPPTFAFQVNEPKLAHFSYQRYLENRLRENFGFEGTPIRLVFKRGGES